MSLSHQDISAALRRKGYSPAAVKVAYDSPGPDWEDITAKLDLPRGVLRDLEADGLEVYAQKAPVASTSIGQRAAEKVRSALRSRE